MIARAGEIAEIGFPVHPHMLRHAAGYKLANDGQDTRAIQHYMGHRNIQHTVRYTELAADRFKVYDDNYSVRLTTIILAGCP
jgi:type 1 fimbriae regulatory protein FimB/type 1 fimbriae regulatory protein FimE